MKHKELTILRNNVLLLFFLVFCCSCGGGKSNFTNTGGVEIAIKNAITDFNKCRLAKHNKTFHIYFTNNSKVFGVGIVAAPEKIYIIQNDSTNILPSKYIEYDGKLYYWYDESLPVSDDVIKKLKQYKLIDSVKTIADIIFVNDDSKIAGNYYFCKNNLSNYYRELTKKSLCDCVPTKLKCVE